MIDEKKDAGAEYLPPEGARSLQNISIDGRRCDYEAAADYIILRRGEKPSAEMFYTSYSLLDEGQAGRPLTFVFNGGPGASSAYLHVGAMGPFRVQLTPGGEVPPPPFVLTENEHCWLQFTDLVFVDPVGTGFSRMIESDKKEAKEAADGKESGYWELKRDLESIGEFVRAYLSKNARWESPVYIAGESYGGFRVGKLAKLLQKDYGVGLAGAVIISPALEFSMLNGSDYDVLPWLDRFPSMAAAAAYHGRSRRPAGGRAETEGGADVSAAAAKDFAVSRLLPVLAAGELLSPSVSGRTLAAAADFLGLPRPVVKRFGGRVPIDYFAKNLLRDEGRIIGLYDASVKAADPFPDRDALDAPDPTLNMLERVFASGINSLLLDRLGLKSERDYRLLSNKVNESWKVDTRKHSLDTHVGSVDDLRYGMSLNPDMKVYITHGRFDLVTPFFSADRLAALMKLSDVQRRMLTVRHYDGGHMFYTWESSRKEFFDDMKIFYSGGQA